MGIHVVKVPDIGEGIAEVELVEWRVRPGDTVAEDQPLADVMTDKATVEVPSPVAGKVIATHGNAGDTLAVGSELARLEAQTAGSAEDSERVEHSDSALGRPRGSGDPATLGPTTLDSLPASAGTKGRGNDEPREVPSVRASAARAPSAPSPSAPKEKPLASPSVRRHARELAVDLSEIGGTGPEGRVTHEDLVRHAAGGIAKPVIATRYAEREGEHAFPVIGMRRQIALHMQASLKIPHFTYVEEIDVTDLEDLRSRLNERFASARGRLTVLPFLMRAIVLSVPAFPQINARFDDDNGIVTRFDAVHIGIATQTDAGLMVPVVRHAEARDLWASAAELARLAQAARAGKATRDELSGSTITITSLGAMGGIVTTPVINAPEVAIVGVNRIVERPVVLERAVVPRRLMNLSSSFDHRVIDGAHGAEFVQALKGYLECPALLFVE